MSGHVKNWKPAEYHHSLIVGFSVKDSSKAIEFYKKAFGAKEIMRMAGPNGKIMHAEMEIGDSRFFLMDEMPEMGGVSPQSIGKNTAGFYLYVENVDEAFKRAIAAGAKEFMPVKDMFWGDRTGSVSDPDGHKWTLATHVKEVSPEEMKKGSEEFWAAMAKR